jgi:radical SAM protein with 4Fe4S-binding SPASM domain
MFTGIAGSFEETISNISRSVEAGIEVTLSTVVTRHNCDEVEKIVDLAHTLGVTGVTITRYLGSSRLGIEATDEQLRVVFEAVDKSDPESFVQHGTCVPQCFTRNSSRGCRAGVAYVAIDPWGNVRPCTLSPTVAGSLLQNSIEEIWSGSTMNSWRARIPIDCLDCPAYSVCHGGCRALQELREDGVDPLRRKPLLEYELKKSLPADLRPKARLRFRTEPFGYAAMGNGEVLPVSRTALDVIEACNGQQTFRHLVDRFGEESLSLLGELWTRGMLEAV